MLINDLSFLCLLFGLGVTDPLVILSLGVGLKEFVHSHESLLRVTGDVKRKKMKNNHLLGGLVEKKKKIRYTP